MSRSDTRGRGATLKAGDLLEVTIEKAVPGGRMIARHDGQVVLVAGAIPGERTAVRVERVEKRLAFAAVTAVIEASPDRREVPFDPACGGCAYAHIAYERQVALKGEVIADAFARIGRAPLAAPVVVAGSNEQGYRMRARLHVEDGRAGFFREGTHQLCDAAPTGQLAAGATESVAALLAELGPGAGAVAAIEISENLAADQRAMHLELKTTEILPAATLALAAAAASLTGCSQRSSTGAFGYAGEPVVGDPLAALTGGRAETGLLRRHAASFFQGNRYLLAALTGHVMDAVPDEGEVLDLYAGVGLFAVALAAAGRAGNIGRRGGSRKRGGPVAQRRAVCGAAARRGRARRG